MSKAIMDSLMKEVFKELEEARHRRMFYHYRRGRWIRRWEHWLKQKFVFR